MDRPSSNPLLGTPPSVSELSNRILSCEKDLAEIKRIVTEMNRKLDTLIAQLGASHVQDPSNNIVIGNAATPCVSWPPGGGASQQFQHDTIASGQNATYNDWGPDGKFEPPRARECVGRPILTSVASGEGIQGSRGSLLFNVRSRRRGRVSVWRSFKFRRVQFFW